MYHVIAAHLGFRMELNVPELAFTQLRSEHRSLTVDENAAYGFLRDHLLDLEITDERMKTSIRDKTGRTLKLLPIDIIEN